MKNWLPATLVVLLTCFVALYFYLPAVVKVSVSSGMNCTIYGSNRVLTEPWTRWWPDSTKHNENAAGPLVFNGVQYAVTTRLYNQFLISMSAGKDTLSSRLTLVQHSVDSIRIFWEYEIYGSSNPLSKFKIYFKARKLRNDSEKILSQLKGYLEKKENIYGFDIHLVSTPKTYLVATSKNFTNYPETKQVYDLVAKLTDYVHEERAAITGFPMLNVTRRDSTVFETMVAIPVDRQLPGKNDIIMRRIVTVKALGVEVHGGTSTIARALHELEKYVLDYRLFSPAIPYENLYTNRLIQPDTSKWITYVYQPLL